MSKAVKVRRAGISRAKKKIPFRAWLDNLPRKLLTYSKNIHDPEGTGWTTEDFALESNTRGARVRIKTADKWSTGTQPRWSSRDDLKSAFKKEKIPF